MLRALHWLPVCHRMEFKVLVNVFKCLHGLSPDYLKPGVHTNDFAPIHRLRALKLGHASLATVFRPGRLTLQPILRENLESPFLRYQPITTAVVTDACLNTRWHHGAYTSAVLRESLGLDRVVTVYAVGEIVSMYAGLYSLLYCQALSTCFNTPV